MAYITVPWNAFPISISTETHARVFIKGCVEVLGLGYHPDTPFAEYVGQDGKRLFSRKDAARLERLHGMLEGSPSTPASSRSPSGGGRGSCRSRAKS